MVGHGVRSSCREVRKVSGNRRGSRAGDAIKGKQLRQTAAGSMQPNLHRRGRTAGGGRRAGDVQVLQQVSISDSWSLTESRRSAANTRSTSTSCSVASAVSALPGKAAIRASRRCRRVSRRRSLATVWPAVRYSHGSGSCVGRVLRCRQAVVNVSATTSYARSASRRRSVKASTCAW